MNHQTSGCFLPFSTVTNLAEISLSHKLSKIPHNNYKKQISFWPINSFYFYDKDKVISLLEDKTKKKKKTVPRRIKKRELEYKGPSPSFSLWFEANTLVFLFKNPIMEIKFPLSILNYSELACRAETSPHLV